MMHEPILPWQSDDFNARYVIAIYFQYVMCASASCFLALLFMSSLAFASEDLAHSAHDRAESISAHPVGLLLSTNQILETFSNTMDRGAVQGGRGISAETRWYADGRFETRWWREGDRDNAPDKVNLVMGRWTAKNNQCCVVFDHAPGDSWQCAAVFQSNDGRLVSLSPDGSVHGIHQIAPLELSAEDPH